VFASSVKESKKQEGYTGGIVLKELSDILSIDLLHSIASCKRLKIKQLNALISLLIKANINFTLTHTPATASEEATTSITIYLKPNVSLTIELGFDTHGMIMY
jgi:hypothetical protein